MPVVSDALLFPKLVASLLVGLLLYFQPFRGDLTFWRPMWVFIVVMFWLLRDPHRFGIGFAWMIGLILDAVTDGVLGQHAIAMTVCAYFVQQADQRMRHFSVWHHVVVIGLMAVFYQSVIVLISLLLGKPADTWQMLYPVVTTCLLWPPVAGVLAYLYKPET